MQKNYEEILKFIFSLYSEDKEINFSFINFIPNYKEKNVYAIDGGSCIALEGGNWLIAKIKAGYSCYNKKRLNEKKYEYAFGFLKPKIKFSPLLKITPKINEIDSDDPISFCRKSSELLLCMDLLDNIKEGVILLDMLLVPEDGIQKNYFNEILKKAKEKNIPIIGIAKTSAFSFGKRTLVSLLNQKNVKGCWYCVVSKGKINNLIVKFHAKSKYVYHIQMPNWVDINEVMPLIGFYSSDPTVLGYPYPLVRADKIARISEFEKRMEKRKIKDLMRKFDFLSYDIRNKDFHSKLDKNFYKE